MKHGTIRLDREHGSNRQHRHQSHPGQAKSFARKRANRQRKMLELATTAQAKGITITELVRQRAEKAQEIRSKSIAAAKAEERTPVLQKARWHPFVLKYPGAPFGDNGF